MLRGRLVRLDSYQPIYFHKDWALAKYLGWSLKEEGEGFRYFARKQGPFDRRILLLHAATEGEIVSTLERKLGAESGLGAAQICVFNPQGEFRDSFAVGRHRFSRCLGEQRMFNTWTYVHDLNPPLEEILAGFAKGARYVCRGAEKAGVEVSISSQGSPGALDSFFQFYAAMAQSRGLRMPERAVVERMLAAGDLLLVACRGQDAVLLQMLLVYICAPYAFYLHGVSNPSAKQEFGQYAHAKVMAVLKERGVRWYDLGGVPSIAEEDGIHRFKKSMGGKLLGPNLEFGYSHPVFDWGRKIYGLVRS